MRQHINETRGPLLLYNILFPLAFFLMLPGLIRRMIRRGKYAHKFGQRFGHFSPAARDRFQSHEWIWVRAVSVGECLMALKLIRVLQTQDPDLHVVLSTTTSTGFDVASKSVSETLEVIYSPVDLPFAVRRSLRIIRPTCIVFIEGEIWPNFTSTARKGGIPMVLVNARMSPRSSRRYAKFRPLTGPFFRLLDVICLQEPEDRPRWISAGARDSQLQTPGSIKYDNRDQTPKRTDEFRSILNDLGLSPGAPVLLGGSTFPQEEEILMRVTRKLKSRFPDLFLIVVPRHFERAPEITASFEKAGFTTARRTTLGKSAQQTETRPRPNCLLVDTTGELREWFPFATVVFMGKSMHTIGGQNPVEPVLAGKPVIFGPHMENFQTLVDRWLEERAVIQVKNEEELESAAARLLADSALRDELNTRARAALKPHQGAIQRTAEIIRQLKVEKRA